MLQEKPTSRVSGGSEKIDTDIKGMVIEGFFTSMLILSTTFLYKKTEKLFCPMLLGIPDYYIAMLRKAFESLAKPKLRKPSCIRMRKPSLIVC